MLRYIALRTFTVDATTYEPGNQVDLSGKTSTTIAALIRQGYVVGAAALEVVVVEESQYPVIPDPDKLYVVVADA